MLRLAALSGCRAPSYPSRPIRTQPDGSAGDLTFTSAHGGLVGPTLLRGAQAGLAGTFLGLVHGQRLGRVDVAQRRPAFDVRRDR